MLNSLRYSPVAAALVLFLALGWASQAHALPAERGVILDQLNGNANLNFDPNKGPVVAPWIAWGPYNWGNGLIPRPDGVAYDCQDYFPDGLHPSDGGGKEKVANQLMNFFKTSPLTTPWFLHP